MFRAAALPEIPPAFSRLKFGDLPLFALLAQSGWIGYIDRPMATYRVHASNMWVRRSLLVNNRATREVMQFLGEHLRPDLRAPWAAGAASLVAQVRAAPKARFLSLLYILEARARSALGLAQR